MSLFTIHLFSVPKHMFESFAQVFKKIEWFVFLLLRYKSSFHILDWVLSRIHVLHISSSLRLALLFSQVTVPHRTSFFLLASSRLTYVFTVGFPICTVSSVRGWFSCRGLNC